MTGTNFRCNKKEFYTSSLELVSLSLQSTFFWVFFYFFFFSMLIRGREGSESSLKNCSLSYPFFRSWKLLFKKKPVTVSFPQWKKKEIFLDIIWKYKKKKKTYLKKRLKTDNTLLSRKFANAKICIKMKRRARLKKHTMNTSTMKATIQG